VSAAAELVGRLSADDANERAKALAALVGLGPAAVPALEDALRHGDGLVRAQAAQGLAEIADPASAESLAAVTGDGDPDVRAHAAAGLARIGDPRALDALVRTIDDAPDLAHHPYTLSVYGLIDLGDTALPAVVPLLSADELATRRRALLVLRSVVSAGGADWDRLWSELGRYDPEAAPAERDAAAGRWAAWVAEHG
jgi:HEAT repeat protein